MPFTSWSDLEKKMRYATFTQFKAAFDYVRSEAARERGEVSPRTYAAVRNW